MTHPWFRFYSEALNDRKITRICRDTNIPKATVLGTWVTILALVNDSPERGILLLTDDVPVTAEDLRFELGLDPETFAALLTAFDRLAMMREGNRGYEVVNWDKRQFQSDNSTDRVRKHRATSEDDDDCNGDETLHDRYNAATETPPDTETDTETDTEQNRIQKQTTEQNAVVSELRKILGRTVANDLIKKYPDRIEPELAYYHWMNAQGKIRAGPGWLRRAIEEHWELPKPVRQQMQAENPRIYTTGEYAELIQT